MSASVVRPEVARFVADVRAALSDLSPEEVEELTGDLEADLSDALGASLGGADPDGAAVPAISGDPDAYAAELRSAAGLPPRAARGGRRGAGFSVAAQGLRGTWDERLAWLRGQPWWSPVSGFLITLRPLWWVVRGWVAFQLADLNLTEARGHPLPQDLARSAVLLVAVVGSVQLGRRGLARRSRTWRWLIGAGNVVALLALSVALSHASQPTVIYAPPEAVLPSNGLWLNGIEVRNVFPYDSQGRPLQGVQLYDENGRPLAVGRSAQTPLLDASGHAIAQVPAIDADGRQRWNVFPLRQQVTDSPAPDAGVSITASAAPPVAPVPPRPGVPPLLVPSPAPSSPTPSSPTPSGTR